MNTYTFKSTFAASSAYGVGVYGCDNYTQGCEATTTQTQGSLVSTGSPWFIPVMLGAALIVAALILIVTKLVRRKNLKKA
ncbi:MAG: hypothetical protein ABIQ04_00685 [Candidatus Saccharimonadales bacterium]